MELYPWLPAFKINSAFKVNSYVRFGNQIVEEVTTLMNRTKVESKAQHFTEIIQRKGKVL